MIRCDLKYENGKENREITIRVCVCVCVRGVGGGGVEQRDKKETYLSGRRRYKRREETILNPFT